MSSCNISGRIISLGLSSGACLEIIAGCVLGGMSYSILYRFWKCGGGVEGKMPGSPAVQRAQKRAILVKSRSTMNCRCDWATYVFVS